MLTPTHDILDFTHRACDGAKFRARSSALLDFVGKTLEDVVEGEAVPAARLARRHRPCRPPMMPTFEDCWRWSIGRLCATVLLRAPPGPPFYWA